MKTIGVVLLALAWTGPAWAGCSNYLDGSAYVSAPRATLCIAGACEQTALDYDCGNAFGAQWGYHNGLTVDVQAKGEASAVKDGRDIAITTIKCTAIDDGACFLLPQR